MKLREVPNYLTVKVRMEYWDRDQYVYFNGVTWINKEGYPISDFVSKEADNDGWYEYKEKYIVRAKRILVWIRSHYDGHVYCSFGSKDFVPLPGDTLLKTEEIEREFELCELQKS